MTVPRLLALVFVLSVASLAACDRAPAGGALTQKPDHRALVQKGARLLDVRSPEEFAGGHVEGARNVPIDELAGRLAEAGPKDQPVVVYCQSGGRSAAAAKLLRSNGFSQVIDIGPMSAW